MEPTPPARGGRSWLPALLWIATAVAAGAGFHWLMPRRAPNAPGALGEPGKLGRGPLTQCLAELRENPDNQALRERIVRLAAGARPAPEIPAEAWIHRDRGLQLFAAAETIDDVGRAVDEFQVALLLAPWWPEANRDLGLALELAQQFEEAVAALRLYLAAGPPAAEARAVEDDVRRIEAALRASAGPEAATDVECRILVPALVAEYWLYVDGRMVSSPPHQVPGFGFTTVSLSTGQGYEFWDARGMAIKVDGNGRLIQVRGDVRDKVYVTETVSLEPGTHRFDLLLLNSGGFPLAVGSREVGLEAGKAAEVRLDMPADYAYGTRADAVSAVAAGQSWQQQFDAAQAFVKGRIAGLAADPVARALAEALAGLRVSAPERPVALVNLPEERGGARELDARLVSALVRHLRSQYEVAEAWASAPAGAPVDFRNALARLLPLIRAHNRRIQDLEEIGRILGKAEASGEK